MIRASILVFSASIVINVGNVNAQRTVDPPANNSNTGRESVVERNRLKVDQIVERIGGEPSASTYSFSVTTPADHQLAVELREVPLPRGYSRGGAVLHKPAAGTADVQIHFSYNKNKVGQAGNPLLNNIDTISYRFESEALEYASVSSFDVPLADMPSSEKKVLLLDPMSEMARTDSGYRLLIVIPKQAEPKTRKDLEAIMPRGEVTISLVPPRKEPTTTQRLSSAWRKQQGAIETTFIKYRRFFQSADAYQPVSRTAMARRLSADNRPISSEVAMRLFRTILTDKGKEVWDQPWGTHEFRSVGLKTLETYLHKDQLSAVRYFDGDIDIDYNVLNRQVNLHQAGDSVVVRTTVRDFRRVGQYRWFELAAPEDIGNGLLRIESDRFTLLADSTSGFIHRMGISSRDWYQFDPMVFPGRITIPRVTMQFNYGGNTLQNAEIVLIDEAQINCEFRRQDFVISIPAGATIVDYRQNTRRPSVRRVREIVTDLAEYVKETNDN